MKRRILLTGIVSILIGCNVFAQRQKETVNFLAEFEWNFRGDYTYQFILQENGKNLLDGPFDMKATINEKYSGYKTFYTSTITGKYTLTGGHSEGYIHGPLALTANMNFSATNGEKQNYTYSLKGNFNKGIPEGNFVVKYPSYGIDVNVNYKGGKLVGSYSLKATEDYLPFSSVGTLTSDSKPTGVWKFSDATSAWQITYLNGVVINRSDYDADLQAKAKSYASGAISKEELAKGNIYVKKDSMALGRDAWMQILHQGIAYDKLGHYAFSSSEFVKFEYLDRLPFFTTEGVEKLKHGLITGEGLSDFSLRDGFTKGKENLYTEFYSGMVQYDSSADLYFCEVHKNSTLCDFCVGYPDWTKYYEKIYMTTEQFEDIQKCLHESRMSKMGDYDLSSLKNITELHYFQPCPYNDSVVVYTYDCRYYPGCKYFNQDEVEDFFIQRGDYEDLLKVWPESRHDVLNEKLSKREESFKNFAEVWFKENVIDKEFADLTYGIRQESDLGESYFPFVSYQAISVDYLTKYGFRISSIANIRTEGEKFKTYKFTTFGSIKDNTRVEINAGSTFSKSNFENIKNDYDVIDELDGEIAKNEVIIENLANDAFKQDYPAYKAYKENIDFSLNHDNLKASIEQRENMIALQQNVVVFVEKLQEVLNGDEEVAQKCTGLPELMVAYDAYKSVRDLSWTEKLDFEKFTKSIAEQKKCMEFAENLTTVNANDDFIKSTKSVASNIFKAYIEYRKECDLTWNAECDFTQIQTLLDIQNKYMAIVDKENIKEINSAVKKQKMKDIVEILNNF